MKKTGLVVIGLLVVGLFIGNLVLLGAQVQVGRLVFSGQRLDVKAYVEKGD